MTTTDYRRALLRSAGADVLKPYLKEGGLSALEELFDMVFDETSDKHATYQPIDNLVRLSNVQAEDVQWLWQGRIPFGKVTMLDGDPGLGKSTLALDVAARLSRALCMPDDSPSLCVPAGTVLLTAEDGLADTIRPRLDALGADCHRIAALESVACTSGRRLPTIRDVSDIQAAVERIDAGLVVIDPITAYLGDDVNGHRDQDVRSALAPLVDMAERLGVAVLMIRHLNKSQSSNALYRGGGSIGFIAGARSALLVAKDPDDESGERRILVSTKSNLGRLPSALAYKIAETNGSIRIEWQGPTKHQANDLLEFRSEEDRSALDEAKEFLRAELCSGPVLSKTIQESSRTAGIYQRTLRRAKDALGVRATKRLGDGLWEWSLQQLGQPTWPGSQFDGLANKPNGADVYSDPADCNVQGGQDSMLDNMPNLDLLQADLDEHLDKAVGGGQ